MARINGIKLLEKRVGKRRLAQKGGRVTYNVNISLNQGDKVRVNETQVQHLRSIW